MHVSHILTCNSTARYVCAGWFCTNPGSEMKTTWKKYDTKAIKSSSCPGGAEKETPPELNEHIRDKSCESSHLDEHSWLCRLCFQPASSLWKPTVSCRFASHFGSKEERDLKGLSGDRPGQGLGVSEMAFSTRSLGSQCHPKG